MYKIIKERKTFSYDGCLLRIVEREEPYMNSADPLIMTRVISPNGGSLPVSLRHKQTLKSIVTDTIALLDSFKKRGIDVIGDMTKPLNE